MTELEWVHATIGGVASIIFLAQVLGSAGSADVDLQADADSPSDLPGHGAGLSEFLSVRNFVAFFIGYGWVTLASLLSGAAWPIASLSGVAAGLVFVVASLLLLKTFLNFQEDGSLKLASLLGKDASVYIMIGASASSTGKVLVDTRTGRVELPARTKNAQDLHPGKLVRVVEVTGDTLWVAENDD
jgi:membrane protein implicated in regulation of membrane protease activity